MGMRAIRDGVVCNGVGGALLLVACLALAADPLQPPVLLGPGAGGGGGNLASQCSDGIDNDGDGLIDWFGNDSVSNPTLCGAGHTDAAGLCGDPGCPTPDWPLGECTDPECAPDPHAPGVGLASVASNVTGWPGAFTPEGSGGCPSGGKLQANTTYQYCAFNSGISVQGDNVTCYGCRIRASGASAAALDLGGHDNFRLVYSRIEPTSDQTPPIAFNSGYEYGFHNSNVGFTFERSHMIGYANAVTLNPGGTCNASHPCTFRGVVFDYPREDNGDMDHTDGPGCTDDPTCRADYLTCTGCTLIGWQIGEGSNSNTNAIALQEGSVDNTGYDHLMITSSYITGWGYAVAFEEGGVQNTNGVFANNWFGSEFKPAFGFSRGWGSNNGSNIWKCNRFNVDRDGPWAYPTASDKGKYTWPGDGLTAAKHATDYNGNTTCPYVPPQCNDGIDNDGDGNIDYPWDSGCTSPFDTSE